MSGKGGLVWASLGRLKLETNSVVTMNTLCNSSLIETWNSVA